MAAQTTIPATPADDVPVPAFKVAIAADIAAVFANPAEFGDLHAIDGTPMHCIFDNNELLKRGQSNVWNQPTDGIYADKMLVYIPVKEYGPKPRIGKPMVLDGTRRYTIKDCVDEAGLYSFVIERNRSQ